MNITASMVSELREKTGIGMMQCKAALTETNGDMEKAIENLRKQGQATVAKRASKSAKEGKITIVADGATTIVFEVNCETDFVSRNDDFIAYHEELGRILLANKPANLEAAQKLTSAAWGGRSAEDRLVEIVGKIGEKITFRRYSLETADASKEKICTYVHGGGKIGVTVKLAVADAAALAKDAVAAVGKDIAMQVAAANPVALSRASVSADLVAKEREIYLEQVKMSGKPEKIWDKIVEGKLDKYFEESVLLEQAFIKDPEKRVNARVAEAEKEAGSAITVVSYLRWELGAE